MWLYDYIDRALAFTIAYFRVLSGSAFDFFRDNIASRSVFGRFYWVSLFICSFAIFYHYNIAQQYEVAVSGDPNLSRCYPNKTLPFLAFFVLAELASFILLIGSRIAGFVVVRLWPAAVTTANGLPIYSIAQKSNIVFRRLYRLMWGWFPITLTLSVIISQDRLQQSIALCAEAGPSASIWIQAIVFPGLVVAFAIVTAANWVFFRWPLDGRLAFLLGVTFASYFVAVVIISPADHVLIQGLRDLPQELPKQLSDLSKALFGIDFK